MDKNLAILIRDDLVTVGVAFSARPSNTEGILSYTVTSPFTYVTDIKGLVVGDRVVAPTGINYKIGTVVTIDEECFIEPNDPITYKFLVAKVDFTSYRDNNKLKEDVEKQVAEAYKKDLRRQFREIVLAGLPETVKIILANHKEEKETT